MEKGLKRVAIIGGDLRQTYLAEILCGRGYPVSLYGVPAPVNTGKNSCVVCSSLRDAVSDASTVIAPVPFTKNKKTITCQQELDGLNITGLLGLLNTNQALAGGCIPCFVSQFCAGNSIACFDYMEDDSLAIFNSIATAEGAVAEAIMRHPSNLHGAHALVMGYGRCGKTLAHKLNGLSVRVMVCARSETARALAHSNGLQTLSFEEYENSLGSFEFIFNTVPAMVLDEQAIYKVNKQALIIDIASAPGGSDFEAADALGLNACLCLGLPGKYSPRSSSEAIADTLIRQGLL